MYNLYYSTNGSRRNIYVHLKSITYEIHLGELLMATKRKIVKQILEKVQDLFFAKNAKFCAFLDLTRKPSEPINRVIRRFTVFIYFMCLKKKPLIYKI